MQAILDDPRASRLEKIEAGRVAASVQGVLIPSPLDTAVPTKLGTQLQLARKAIAERLFEQQSRKAIKNRRQYVRRRIAELTESGSNPELLAEFTNELNSLSLRRNGTQERPQAPVDPQRMAQLREWAETRMKEIEERA